MLLPPYKEEMSLLVQKYGGTSVGSPKRILSVAERIAKVRARGHQLVVVVSAMGHTTDELIELAHRVSDRPPHREMDMLLTAGERISMALLSMALSDLKIPAVSFTGSQTGIITDSSHRCARIRQILGDRVRSALAEDKVAIVAGFQGVSETKEITTLGRGGSDTTAVALAATLGAESCEIFTDVDGVFSADPRIVPQAWLWSQIPHDLMVEMATRGAGVLHPRSVELSKQFGVVLRVRSSLNESEGTEVMSRKKEIMEEYQVVGVTSDPGKALLIVDLMRPTVLSSIWDAAAHAHLSVVAPMFSAGRIAFFAERDAEGDWKKKLEQLSNDGFVSKYEFDKTVVPVSIVGDRFSQDGAALSEVIEALGKHKILVTHGVASALAITVAVSAGREKEAVQALHARFLGEGRKN